MLPQHTWHWHSFPIHVRPRMKSCTKTNRTPTVSSLSLKWWTQKLCKMLQVYANYEHPKVNIVIIGHWHLNTQTLRFPIPLNTHRLKCQPFKSLSSSHRTHYMHLYTISTPEIPRTHWCSWPRPQVPFDIPSAPPPFVGGCDGRRFLLKRAPFPGNFVHLHLQKPEAAVFCGYVWYLYVKVQS